MDDDCKYDESKGVGTVSSWVEVTKESQEAMQIALMMGPVSVAIAADQQAFLSYASGVIPAADCPGTEETLDHAVLAVGYGKEAHMKGKDYWIIKNSWDGFWGEKGYARLEATKAGPGACGV